MSWYVKTSLLNTLQYALEEIEKFFCENSQKKILGNLVKQYSRLFFVPTETHSWFIQFFVQ